MGLEKTKLFESLPIMATKERLNAWKREEKAKEL